MFYFNFFTILEGTFLRYQKFRVPPWLPERCYHIFMGANMDTTYPIRIDHQTSYWREDKLFSTFHFSGLPSDFEHRSWTSLCIIDSRIGYDKINYGIRQLLNQNTATESQKFALQSTPSIPKYKEFKWMWYIPAIFWLISIPIKTKQKKKKVVLNLKIVRSYQWRKKKHFGWSVDQSNWKEKKAITSEYFYYYNYNYVRYFHRW